MVGILAVIKHWDVGAGLPVLEAPWRCWIELERGLEEGVEERGSNGLVRGVHPSLSMTVVNGHSVNRSCHDSRRPVRL